VKKRNTFSISYFIDHTYIKIGDRIIIEISYLNINIILCSSKYLLLLIKILLPIITEETKPFRLLPQNIMLIPILFQVESLSFEYDIMICLIVIAIYTQPNQVLN